MKGLIRSFGLSAALLASLSPASADTLRDIYELALKNDAALKAAEASYRANLENENQARAALLPQIYGEANYTDVDADSTSNSINYDSGSNQFVTQKLSTSQNTYGDAWGVTLSQKLFDLPAWFSFKAGQEVSQQAEAQFSYEQQGLIVRVVEAYFNVLRQRDNLEASRAEERATKRQLEQTQQRFDVGLIAITDVHEARAVYDNTVVRRLTDEGNLGTAYEALTVLTGQTHSDLWALNHEFPVVDPQPLNRGEWVDFAMRNNFALKAAEAASEAARHNSRAKKMEHLPKVTGNFRYYDEQQHGDRLTNPVSAFTANEIDDDSDSEVLQINLSMPIFTSGLVSSQRRQALEQFHAASQQKINTQRKVVQATRSLHLQVTTDVQRVKARQQAIISAQSALDATQAGYEVGTRNIVDVLNAQRGLYAAIRDYSNARYDYVINRLKLKQQAGTLSPADVYELEKWLEVAKSSNAS